MPTAKRKIVSPESESMPMQTTSTNSSDMVIAKNCCDNCGHCDACQAPWWQIWKTRSYVPILVVLVIIASFLLGMLSDKLYFQGTGGQAGIGSQQGQTAGQQPGAPQGKVNVSLGHLPIKGQASAKVTIVEFADFRCPFCEKFFTDTEPQIIKDYVDTGKAKFAFRQFPFLGPASTVAADGAECANDQGKFWEFHDYLYKNQPPESDTSMFNTSTLTQTAVSLGMNGDQFKSCLDGKKDDSKAQSDMTDGQKAGVSGTPTFYVNGIQLVGAQPYSAFKTVIDQELKK